MQMNELSEAYVLGLLADAEAKIPEATAALTAAQARAQELSADFGAAVSQLAAVKQRLKELQRAANEANATIAAGNKIIASTLQSLDVFKRRSQEMRLDLEKLEVGSPAHRQLRRERAGILVEIEEGEKQMASARSKAEEARRISQESEAEQVRERDNERNATKTLDALQSLLPDPTLYVDLCQARMARAHGRLFLFKNAHAWRAETAAALLILKNLHQELRSGKYQFEASSGFLGGRMALSSEGLLAAVLLGDLAQARDIFAQAALPEMYFHHIFNVFRIWCVGLYLTGRNYELGELLQRHRYAQGLQGGYVQAFRGLMERDATTVNSGLRSILKHEWELWQNPNLLRGMGVVNLGASAIARMAIQQRLSVTVSAATMPPLLWSSK